MCCCHRQQHLRLQTWQSYTLTVLERSGILLHNVEGLAGQLSGGAHDEADRPLAALDRHADLWGLGQPGEWAWGAGGGAGPPLR